MKILRTEYIKNNFFLYKLHTAASEVAHVQVTNGRLPGLEPRTSC